MSILASATITIDGRVQGVFFRAFASRQAIELGLTGYARNLRGGAVEVQAEGEREQIEKLVDRLRTGPPAARVVRLSTRWSEYTGNYNSFDIRH